MLERGVGCVYLFESDLKSKNHVLNCDDILLGVRFDQSEYKVRKALNEGVWCLILRFVRMYW